MRHLLLLSLCACAPLLFAACGDAAVDASPDARGLDGPSPDTADACHDGVQNGGESDIDCGGPCPQACRLGQRCDGGNPCEIGTTCHGVASCDGDDCAAVCMIDRVSCYPNPCSADEVCDASLPFDGEPGRAFCQRRHAAGEDCEQRDRDLNDCVDGYQCRSTSTPFEYTCQPTPTTPLAPAGAQCLNDDDCAHGLFCNSAYRCEARGALDATCFAGNLPCQPGLHCIFPTGLACEIWIDCGSDMACCATATGSECRPGALDQCTPPAGSCRRPA